MWTKKNKRKSAPRWQATADRFFALHQQFRSWEHPNSIAASQPPQNTSKQRIPAVRQTEREQDQEHLQEEKASDHQLLFAIGRNSFRIYFHRFSDWWKRFDPEAVKKLISGCPGCNCRNGCHGNAHSAYNSIPDDKDVLEQCHQWALGRFRQFRSLWP